MATLYELIDDIKHLQSVLDTLYEEPDGSEDTAQLIQSVLAEKSLTEEARIRKVESYVALIRIYETHAKIRLEESKRLSVSAKIEQNKADNLREQLKFYLETVQQVERVKTPFYEIKIATNGGKQSLDLDEAFPMDKVPEEFKKLIISVEFNKDAIREALEVGEVEAFEFARLKPRGTHLRIK